MAFLNIPGTFLSLLLVGAILGGYTIVWVIWLRPRLMDAVEWTAKKRKYDEASQAKFSTIAGTVATFAFFVCYVPLGGMLVRGFGIWNDPLVEGSKLWAGIGLAGAYVFQSHFFSLTLGGLKVLLLRAMKKKDFVEFNTEFGKLWAAGTVLEIDTHGTKLRYLDGSVHTLPNEKLLSMDIRNYDHDKWHHMVLDIPLREGELHTHLAEEAIAAITSLQSEEIAALDDTDTDWYKDNVEAYSLLTLKEAQAITGTFEPGVVRIRVPVRKHIKGLRLQHEAIGEFPELFGRVEPRHILPAISPHLTPQGATT